MKLILLIIYAVVWCVGGISLEESGITKPAFFALYGIFGVWGAITLMCLNVDLKRYYNG